MKYLLLTFACVFLFFNSEAQYNTYFSSSALRIEYVIAGDHNGQQIFLHALHKNEMWGGPHKNLLDTVFNYGHYRIMVYDSLGNRLIYSRGFSSLFREWQDTPEAFTRQRAYKEAVVIPFPLKTVRFDIERRDKKNIWQPLYSIYINPEKDVIGKEKPMYKTFDIQIKGNSSEKVDVVFVPDGYTNDEMQKFRDDAKRFAGYLMGSQPFSASKESFNIRAVELPSPESGTDLPGENVWKNTAIASSFYTFDMERYLNVFDLWTLYDAISGIPHDQVFVIVNSAKYGGSGIFNYYAICSSDNPYSEYVTVHEFGHAFGGLADEYYDKSTTYTDYYPAGVEPWEPNITTLTDFGKKWKGMLDKKTPVPTPATSEHLNTLGVFEGGGYTAKGVYRPRQDCTMKSNRPDNFCPVCRAALLRMIDFYCDR
jgi:hypothetical protein